MALHEIIMSTHPCLNKETYFFVLWFSPFLKITPTLVTSLYIYQAHIWDVSLQLGCSDTCQTWMWFNKLKYFCKQLCLWWRNQQEDSHLNQAWVFFKTYHILCVDCDPCIHQLTRPELPNRKIHTCSTTWHSFYKHWLPKLGLDSGITKNICIWLWDEISYPCPDIKQKWHLCKNMKDYFSPTKTMGYNQ